MGEELVSKATRTGYIVRVTVGRPTWMTVVKYIQGNFFLNKEYWEIRLLKYKIKTLACNSSTFISLLGNDSLASLLQVHRHSEKGNTWSIHTHGYFDMSMVFSVAPLNHREYGSKPTGDT